MNTYQKLYEKEIEELVEACHRCAQLGYVTSSGGNLSYRMNDGNILITPTKTPKRSMRFEDICIIDSCGEYVYLPDGKKPTGETPFHVRIMNKRPDIRAIVHAHPPIITGFAIAHSDLLAMPFLPEPIIEVGPMMNVKYATPLSEELSEAFDEVIEKTNGFIMQNHGALICCTQSIDECVDELEMMEAQAKSVLISVILKNTNVLTSDDVKELDNVIRVRNLKMPGMGKNTLEDVYSGVKKTPQ